MTLVLPIIDTLRELLPLPTGDLADGVTKDDSGSQPAKTLPKRLYVWPMRTGPQVLQDEPQGRASGAGALLRVGVMATLGARGEPRVMKRERDLSEALDAWISAIETTVLDNRHSDLWWDAFVETTTFDAVRTAEVRAHLAIVTLRLNT